jgi:hypothetical protein
MAQEINFLYFYFDPLSSEIECLCLEPVTPSKYIVNALRFELH